LATDGVSNVNRKGSNEQTNNASEALETVTIRKYWYFVWLGNERDDVKGRMFAFWGVPKEKLQG
jgi:hypothetical protein